MEPTSGSDLARQREARRDAEDASDHAAAWQRWLFEEALGGSPTPVHLPRRLLKRLGACTVSDRISTPRER